MKRLVRTLLTLTALSFVSVFPLAAQFTDPSDAALAQVHISPPQSLSPSSLRSRFAQVLTSDDEVKVLAAGLSSRGFKPLTASSNFFGRTTTLTGANSRTGKITLYVQDYSKAGSSDLAALVQIRVSSGERSEVRSIFVIAPSGNFADTAVEEYGVDKGLNLVRNHSWWSCVKERVKSKCGTACVGSLVTCTGTWTAYLGCVAVRCGACLLSASACCGCDCPWWCKWAAGCCK